MERKININIHIDGDLLEKLDAYLDKNHAKYKGSRAAVIREFIKDGLEAHAPN